MSKQFVHFDPRSKLCTVLFASYLLMFKTSFQMEITFVSLLFILLLINGGQKKALLFYGLFWLLVAVDNWFFPKISGGFSLFISFLLVGNRRLLPTIMAASLAMNRTKISEWIAALKKIHLPNGLLIPLTVLFRFFPTLFQDFKSIRSAMKFRGIALNNWQLLAHPLQTLEYIVVPILMTAENTSLDLSAAALVRGLDNPEEHTSIYPVKLKIQDVVLLIALLGLTVAGRVGVI